MSLLFPLINCVHFIRMKNFFRLLLKLENIVDWEALPTIFYQFNCDLFTNKFITNTSTEINTPTEYILKLKQRLYSALCTIFTNTR